MISVFGRHLVGSEAGVERIDLFLRSIWVLPAETYWLARIASPAAMSDSLLMPIPKNKLSAARAAFGDGGIHTQWPKIMAKLFIGPSTIASYRAMAACTGCITDLTTQSPIFCPISRPTMVEER